MLENEVSTRKHRSYCYNLWAAPSPGKLICALSIAFSLCSYLCLEMTEFCEACMCHQWLRLCSTSGRTLATQEQFGTVVETRYIRLRSNDLRFSDNESDHVAPNWYVYDRKSSVDKSVSANEFKDYQ
ncbi:hypothetical protein J6590_070159 [Homalodisca vitripennis]|nr:hypothetical protein J6590_070159 [Homalodisca vitripennis]